ncbi:hypothetical protein P3T48_11470, partial [Prevotella sp. B2-R-102]|nr:hypothetical protein [Prevotella sp. B2-R-102]
MELIFCKLQKTINKTVLLKPFLCTDKRAFVILIGRVFKIRLKSDAFFTYGIDAFHCQIWREVCISPFFNVPMS